MSVQLTEVWAVNVENHIRLCSDKFSYVFSKHLRVLSSPDVLIQSEGFIARDFFCLQTDKIWLRSKGQRLDDPSVLVIMVRSQMVCLSTSLEKRKKKVLADFIEEGKLSDGSFRL